MSEQPATPPEAESSETADEREPQGEQERSRQEENAETSLDQPSS